MQVLTKIKNPTIAILLPDGDKASGKNISGVARAFPGGRLAHPESQIEEENEGKLRKNVRKYRKMRKN